MKLVNTSRLLSLVAVFLLSRGVSATALETDDDVLEILNGGLAWWHPGGGGRNASNDTSSHSSCSSYSSCTSCSDASWCHWCDGDQACHAVGSIHGCIRGSDCLPPPPPPPVSNDTCAAHGSCADCTKHSSHLCHWCAHDNACHAIGSVYGCVAGVDCYSNDRCQRRASEPIIPANATFTMIDQVAMGVSQIGFFPLMAMMILAASCACCVSLCFCCTSGVKGAYDDLLAVYHERDLDNHVDEGELLYVANAAAEEGHATPTTSRVTDYVQLGEPSENSEAEDGDADENLVHFHTNINEETNQLTAPLLVQRRRRPEPRHMQRLFNYCRLCYVLTLLAIVGFAIASILYFPKIPSYNVCNDAVAWGSLIDSLTNMKATADFEILVSVSNPNHFALALDRGMGSFTHNGAFVGTYDIPPTLVAPMAITDLLMVAHLAPDKWDALGLVAEYYRGRLVLYVDAEATLRIPMLANYTFTTALKNIVVNVNEQSERHLCACPNWDDMFLGEMSTLDEAAAAGKDESALLLPLEPIVAVEQA